MHQTTARRISAAAIILAAASAQAHNHLTVDTTGGQPGDQILIVAGYYPNEEVYSIQDGQLRYCEEPQVYSLVDQLGQAGPFNGWYAGFDVLLTSDFYFSTGRLDGGDFRWELAAVEAISAGPAAIAWGKFGASGFTPSAQSAAGDRLGRSFDTKVAGHDHTQGYAISAPGVYDLTLIAWDSNGVYADSAPVKVRFRVGSACASDFDGSGFVDTDDYDAFVLSFIAGEPCADIDHSGFVDTDDFDVFVRAFELGC